MSNNQFSTPILFLVFNRPSTTKKVFEKIREIKPKYLYVVADGPRKNKEGETSLCNAVREIIDNGVDWPCNIVRNYRDKNFGCGKGVSNGITWFFEQVEEGIIVEDDILPSTSFFNFCEELLVKFRDDNRVMSINGSNLLDFNTVNESSSFLFSNYAGIWGWASWRRAWSGYDYDINSWKQESTKASFNNRFSKGQFLFFEEVFNAVHNKDTWDYQWWYHILYKNGLCIIPSCNLTKNIGFGVEGTHTHDAVDELANAKADEIEFPLKYPKKNELNKKYDLILAKKYYWKEETSLVNSLKLKVKSLFR